MFSITSNPLPPLAEATEPAPLTGKAASLMHQASGLSAEAQHYEDLMSRVKNAPAFQRLHPDDEKKEIEQLTARRNQALEAGLSKLLGATDDEPGQLHQELAAVESAIEAEREALHLADKLEPARVRLAGDQIESRAKRAVNFHSWAAEYERTKDPYKKRAFQMFGGPLAEEHFAGTPQVGSFSARMARDLDAAFHSPTIDKLSAELAGLRRVANFLDAVGGQFDRLRPPVGIFHTGAVRSWQRKAAALWMVDLGGEG
jgi:hypothetical protein